MTKRVVTVLVTIGAAFFLSAQTVTFNTPTEWMSSRDNKIVAKALLDTAKIEKRKIKMALVKVENGRERTMSSKVFSVKDYSQEFSLGAIPSKALGGTSYLKINWSIPGKNGERGSLKPFGVLIVDDRIDSSAVARKIDSPMSLAAAKAALKESDYVSVGSHTFGVVWNSKAIGVACSKAGKGPITFTFDGKNGKNAFLAFADRFVQFTPATESVGAYHYSRQVTDTAIAYTRKSWKHEIAVASEGDLALVTIPWHDVGMLPLDDRMTGFAAFVKDDDGKVVAALPKDAQTDIPGTWGNVIFPATGTGAKAE